MFGQVIPIQSASVAFAVDWALAGKDSRSAIGGLGTYIFGERGVGSFLPINVSISRRGRPH